MSRQNSPDILDLDQTTPEDVLSDLSSAIASDNEEAFTSVLTSYVASDRCQRISDLYPIMHQATEYDKPYFLSELLRNGMGFNFSHVHNAVMDKAKRCLEVFFQNGYDINQPLCDTRPSVIQYAFDDDDMTHWLIDHGADLNQQCYDDLTPMSYAVEDATPSLIRALLDRGVDVHKGQLLPHALERKTDVVQVMTMLLDKGAPLNEIMYETHPPSSAMYFFMDHGTPLSKAVKLGLTDVVRFLLERGADASIKDTHGKSPRDSAEAGGNVAILDMLVEAERTTHSEHPNARNRNCHL